MTGNGRDGVSALGESGIQLASSTPVPEQLSSIEKRYPHDIANVLMLRLAGVRVKNERPTFSMRGLAVLTLFAASPLILCLFLQLVRPAPASLAIPYLLWHAYFLLLTEVAILFAWIGCHIFYALTPKLDEALTDEGLAAYHRWANQNLKLLRQLSFMITASVGAAVALAVAVTVPGMSARLYVSPTSYLSVMVTGFFIAGGICWIGPGTVLAYPLSRRGHLRLLWLAPARTPGIEALARCYRQGFYFSAVGSALALVPLLNWLYHGPDSGQLIVVKFTMLGVSTIASLFIAVLPQWWLSSAIIAARANSLKELKELLPPRIAVVDLDDGKIGTLANLIKTVSDSPASTVNDRTIAAMLLGAVAALLPYAVQFALR